MIKRIIIYTTILLLFLACSKENGFSPEGEMVEMSIGVSMEGNGDETTIATRANTDGANVNADWAIYDVRYILEVWTTAPPATRVVRKMVVREQLPDPDGKNPTTIIRNPAPVSFTVKLPANARYDFLFWADLVAQGDSTDLFYDVQPDVFGLRNINIISGGSSQSYTGNTPARDAYAGCLIGKTIAEASATSVTLKRPLAKVVFQATGLTQKIPLNTKISVFYESNLYHSYNVAAGISFGTFSPNPSYNTTPYDDYNSTTKTQTLMSDYFFTSNPDNTDTIKIFVRLGTDQGREPDKVVIKRNRVTTVSGQMKTLFATGQPYKSANGSVQGIICWTNPYGSEALIMSLLDYGTTTSTQTDWVTANTWAEGLNQNGETGKRRWRLPNKKEVLNMFDPTWGIPALAGDGETGMRKFGNMFLYNNGVTDFTPSNVRGLYANNSFYCWTGEFFDQWNPDLYFGYVIPALDAPDYPTAVTAYFGKDYPALFARAVRTLYLEIDR